VLWQRVDQHFGVGRSNPEGQADKTMVATGSRKEAVRYRFAIDKYIHAAGYSVWAPWSPSPAK